MPDRIDCLTYFTILVAGSQTTRFGDAVKLAYHAGASREDLLTAAEIGRVLADAPDPVVVQAYAAIDAWHWIPQARPEWRGSPAAQVA